jgi:hypothetical protein
MASVYIIEGNMNFYDELYKSLDDNNQPITDENVCLITNLPLLENHVKLECGHRFNYGPLYHDISSHKKKHNSMERQSLKATELRCPYCRNIQKNLLPEYEGYPLVHGVNYINPLLLVSNSSKNISSYIPIANGYDISQCCYENNEGQPICSIKYGKTFEPTSKFYCLKHYNVINKQVAKEAIMAAKLKKKEDAKKANEDAKKKPNAVVVDSSTSNIVSVSSNMCQHVLLTGKNKGGFCSKTTCKQTQYCKTHVEKYVVN